MTKPVPDVKNGRIRVTRYIPKNSSTKEKVVTCRECGAHHNHAADARRHPCCKQMDVHEKLYFSRQDTYLDWCVQEVKRLKNKGCDAVIEKGNGQTIAVFVAPRKTQFRG